MTVQAKPSIQDNRSASGDPETVVAAKPPLKHILGLLVIPGVLLAVVYFSPLREYLGRFREVSEHVRRLGWLAPWVFTVGVAVLVAAGFPRLLFCVISGMALGFWWGLLWAQLGTLLGNYMTFLVVRAGGREWGRRYLAKRHALNNFLQSDGIPAVVIARQLPVPGLVLNLAFGLSSLTHRHFLIGTAIGQIPEAVPCTLFGAGAIQASFGQSAGVMGLAVAVLLVLWIGFRRLLRAFKRP